MGQSYKKAIIKVATVILLCSIILINLSSCDFNFLYKDGVKEATSEYDLANGPDTLDDGAPRTWLYDSYPDSIDSHNGRPDSRTGRAPRAFVADARAPLGDIIAEDIYIDFSAPYATYSIINDGYAKLYKHSDSAKWNGKTIAVNAGHGTKGGSQIKTFSHPDFSPKVSGGTTAAGSILSTAVSDGTVLNSGMTEAEANLLIAMRLKDKLLDAGYNVLMIREDDNCKLDNIARTVIADTNADCHIAIHFDSTETDKGIFYIAPYNDSTYLSMVPLRDNAKNINDFGRAVLDAYKEMGEKLWKDKGVLQGDLTQISYSIKPSIDIELGDKATVVDETKIETLAEGLLRGIDKYWFNK